MKWQKVVFRIRGICKMVFVTFLLVTVMPILKIFFVLSPTFRRDMSAWAKEVFKESPQKVDEPSLVVSWAMIKHILLSIRFLTFCSVNCRGKAHNSRLLALDSKKETRLFEYMQKDRPLVVNFGSCTSPAWIAQLKHFKELINDFRQTANFVIVYTKEAHPSDGWRFNSNNYQIAEHLCLQDRLNAAKHLENIGIPCPVTVDLMDNNGTYAYAAVSERFYILINGKCVFKGDVGPEDHRTHDVRIWLNNFTSCPKSLPVPHQTSK